MLLTLATQVKPKCSTPHQVTPRPTGVSALPSTSRASQMPPPARANALPSTSSAARKPPPTRVNAVASASTSRAGQKTPPARVGPPVFYNLQNIGIQDRETLEILTVQEYEDLLPPFNNPYRVRLMIPHSVHSIIQFLFGSGDQFRVIRTQFTLRVPHPMRRRAVRVKTMKKLKQREPRRYGMTLKGPTSHHPNPS
jgi:hypothetical protein